MLRVSVHGAVFRGREDVPEGAGAEAWIRVGDHCEYNQTRRIPDVLGQLWTYNFGDLTEVIDSAEKIRLVATRCEDQLHEGRTRACSERSRTAENKERRTIT